MKTLKYIRIMDVDEKFLDDTYKDIIEFWAFVLEKKKKQEHKLMKDKIKKIKEDEQKEQKEKAEILDIKF